MDNDCKGCESYVNGRCELGILLHMSETEQCPCSTCLVKVTCEDNVCEAFVQYARKSGMIQNNNFNPTVYNMKREGKMWGFRDR